MKKFMALFLVVFFILISPISAYASTTESMMMFATGSRSVPNGYNIAFTLFSQNKDTRSYNEASEIYLKDNSSTLYSTLNLSGLTSNNLLGFHLGFVPSISGSFYSEHIIDFSVADFRIYNRSNSNYLTLSPYSIPVEAYAQYIGTFDYQIYDGSVGYDRWIYDNQFVITKPVSISLNDFGSYGTAGFDASISVPAMSSVDLLDVTAYRNIIKDATSFDDTDGSISLEDYSYENIRISCDVVNVYFFYEIDKTNFIPWSPSHTSSIPTSLDDCQLQFYLYAHSSNDGVTSVNVRDIDYLNDTNFSFKNISNGIASIASSIGSGMSNIVSNATQNADRIIQNTTQKVDEVKQGVTDVKNSVVETKNSILDLPNKIKDMLLGLIVPSSETMANKYTEFSQLLEQKLGIIYQIPMMLFSFFDTIVNAATTPQTTLTLPAFTLPWIDGTTLTIWEPIEYKIIPDGMQVLSDLIQTVTSMTVVVLTFNSVKRAYERFLRS